MGRRSIFHLLVPSPDNATTRPKPAALTPSRSPGQGRGPSCCVIFHCFTRQAKRGSINNTARTQSSHSGVKRLLCMLQFNPLHHSASPKEKFPYGQNGLLQRDQVRAQQSLSSGILMRCEADDFRSLMPDNRKFSEAVMDGNTLERTGSSDLASSTYVGLDAIPWPPTPRAPAASTFPIGE